jgi:hypothetical protein
VIIIISSPQHHRSKFSVCAYSTPAEKEEEEEFADELKAFLRSSSYTQNTFIYSREYMFCLSAN